MANDFDGKHVVVTGATGGLGGAVVESLLDRGATCHLPFVESTIPERITWAKHPRVTIYRGIDLLSEQSVSTLYASLPPLWASVNLVGGFAMAPIAETSLADFTSMLTLNAQTCFLCCREAVKSMRKHGDGGRIVNVAARPAIEPTAGMSAYAASKGAIAAFTRGLAAELAAERILVNAIVPSIIDTPTNRKAMPDADFDKWPKAAEVAEIIAFLIAPANRLTHGALVPVYGGM